MENLMQKAMNSKYLNYHSLKKLFFHFYNVILY